MPWTDLLNQNRVIEALRRAISADRVAHAYLFYGPDGAGKTATALEFARALQCEQGGDEACGRCLACSKVRRLIHPDVHVLFPFPKYTSVDEVSARLRLLADDPYAVVDFVRRPFLDDSQKSSNKQVIYSVDRVHEELHRPMSFRPAEGRYKITIVTDVHLMRVEGANAFLKLLEEPGPRTVFILTSSRPDRLLPTIISRCQQVRFDSLDPEVIAQALLARADVLPEHAAAVARMAGGSVARAFELLAGEDLQEHRKLIVDFFRNSYLRRIEPLSETIDIFSRLSRERVKSLMPLMHSWIRDLVLYKTMGSEADLVNIDQAEAIAKFCANLPDARLDDMVALVEQARELAERNVHITLLLSTLAQRLGAAMHGEPAPYLYQALAEPAAESL